MGADQDLPLADGRRPPLRHRLRDPAAAAHARKTSTPRPRRRSINPGCARSTASSATRPGLIDKWFAFYQPVVRDSSNLPLRTKELCRLRIAARNGCMFCLGGRFRDDDGVPVVDDDDVDAVLAGRFDDPRFTASESAAMRFTEVYRLDHTAVDKVLVDETLETSQRGAVHRARPVHRPVHGHGAAVRDARPPEHVTTRITRAAMSRPRDPSSGRRSCSRPRGRRRAVR